MEVRVWKDSYCKESPLMIVVPGFLNETPTECFMGEWSGQAIRFANEHSFSVGGLYWDSRGLSNHRVTDLDLYKLPRQLLATWRDAQREADRVSIQLRKVLKTIDRPVILVGHSLGGRIVLKAAERVRKGSIHAIIALAPAYESAFCKYDRIDSAVKMCSIICYSKQDKVLSSLFTLGQSSKSVNEGLTALKRRNKWAAVKALSEIVTYRVTHAALGLDGIPESAQAFESIKPFNYFNLGHLDYCNELYNILDTHKDLIWKPTSYSSASRRG